MKHALLTVGKPKAGYIAQGLDEYVKRLKAFGGCERINIKPERASKGKPKNDIMAAEAKRILGRLDKRDVVWALDPRGQALSSEQWAAELDKARLSGRPRLVLVIGGALGLHSSVFTRADKRVSFGPPTLAHEIAALAALEQLYRAHTILAGTPYHRG